VASCASGSPRFAAKRVPAVSDPGLAHLDERGAARMVDVGSKAESRRTAVATGRLLLSAATLARVGTGDTPKGDVLAVARVAGIQAAKQTGALIPLCHPLALTSASVDITIEPETPAMRATATVTTIGPTGVEMEALTAVSVALLTLYDMLKGIERGMVIDGIGLVAKEGGSRGPWARDEAASSRP